MRMPRFYIPGNVHHVITRFVDRRFFLDLPGARDKYLSLLSRSLERSDWRCLGYGLMSNHVHLEMLAGDEEPEFLLKRIHSPFGVWLNKRHDGLGAIIAGRPSTRIVQGGLVGKVLAYIHNNPVRAGVAPTAIDSRWTSHRAYVGLEPVPSWLDVSEGLRLSGHADRRDHFDEWVRAEVGETDLDENVEQLVQRARPLAHRRGAVEVATPTIADKTTVQIVARRGGFIRPEPAAVIAVVSMILGESIDTVHARGATQIRKLVLVVGRMCGLTVSELCATIGISRQRGQQLLLLDPAPDPVLVGDCVRQLHRWRDALDKLATVPGQGPGRIGNRRARRLPK